MKLLRAILLAIICLIPLTARAEDLGGYTITNYDATLDIKSTGAIHVTEQIQANFTEERHGIFRTIPTLSDTPSGKRRVSIEVQSVELNHQSVPYTVKNTYDQITIKIGDPDKTVKNLESYVIHYTATGALRSTDTGLIELAWNVTGNSWSTTIFHSSASVKIPTSSFIDAACYRGTTGATMRCSSIQTSSNEATAREVRTLTTNEGLTIALTYPKGVTATPEVPIGATPAQQFAIGSIITLLISLTLAVQMYRKRGRDLAKMSPVVVPEYEVPHSLNPAQSAMLLGESGNPAMFASTIIQLANLGYMSIEKSGGGKFMGMSLGTSYTFTRLKKGANKLSASERYVFKLLFPDTEMSATTKELIAQKVGLKLPKLYETIQEELVKASLLAEAPKKLSILPAIIGGSLLAASVISLIAGAQTASEQAPAYAYFLIGIAVALGVSSIAWFVVAGLSSRRTVKGVRVAEKIKGYKLFLKETEKYRQPWLEKEGAFAQLIPYAIALGVASQFAKAMGNLYPNQTAPAWFIGTNTSMSSFTNDLVSFSSTMTSSVSAAGTSSSGGGSSSGGFGGGGGGAW